MVSCGYGKKNVGGGIKSINELSALAKGSYHSIRQNGIILDIGGQDTKVISQVEGVLTEFFLNDKCAAGSGIFLSNTLDLLGMSFDKIDLMDSFAPKIKLNATCAVFAQSEIVELIAANKFEQEILCAVLWQIFVKARLLLTKVDNVPVFLSGGLCQIIGIEKLASAVLGRECFVIPNGSYLAAIGCALCG